MNTYEYTKTSGGKNNKYNNGSDNNNNSNNVEWCIQQIPCCQI